MLEIHCQDFKFRTDFVKMGEDGVETLCLMISLVFVFRFWESG